MRTLRSQKLKFLVVGALLFAVAWVGYWIGYMQYRGPDMSDPQFALKGNTNDFKISIYKDLQKKLPYLNIGHKLLNVKEKDNNKVNVKDFDNNLTNQKKGHLQELEEDKKEAGKEVENKHLSGLHEEHAKAISEVKKGINKKNAESDELVQNIKKKLAAHNADRDLDWVKEQNDVINQQEQQEQNRVKIIAQKLSRNKIVNELGQGKHTMKQLDVPFQSDKKLPMDMVDDSFYALIHNGLATKVQSKIHKNIQSMPDHISPDLYILHSKDLPTNPRERPSIGNGNLATVVHTETVYMNGIYNGYKNGSHRAAIPSTCSVKVTGTQPPSDFTRTYSLNLAEGIYTEEILSDQYVLNQRLYAHRNMTRLLVVEVDLERKSLAPLTLQVTFNRWTASSDITFLKTESDISEVGYKHGRINSPETDQLNYTEVHLYYDHIPNELVPPSKSLRTKWVFITAIAHSKRKALQAYKEGKEMISNHDKLYATHVEAWADLWARGAIHIEGNKELAKSVYSSSYYLMSSLPVKVDNEWPFFGVSPSGLPYGDVGLDYEGHVFWDQETWVYPPVLFFHSDIGEILLATRNRTRKAASELARTRGCGDHSMEYPWESAFSGSDVTTAKTCSIYEIHISGDISLAILQYLYATGNTDIIHQPGGYAEILAGVANFWVSKLKYNKQKDKYEILGVQPPDERAGVVNNSVYTNTVAQMSLAAMEYVFKRVHKSQTYWKTYADKIYIPFDPKLQYHPEYDGYYKGKLVKQADAILLGYPLNRKMANVVRRNDLTFYEQSTETTGPAMTWCMFSIGWLELNEQEKGNTYFEKYKQYIRGDFQIWNEVPDGNGAVNFITGIGGFLQNIIAGYGGFRLYPNHLEFNPVLPPGVTQLSFVDIDYLGSTIDFVVSNNDISVILRRQQNQSLPLSLYVYSTEELHVLKLGQFVKIPKTKGAVLNAEIDFTEP